MDIEELENGQLMANYFDLVRKQVDFIVPAVNFRIKDDERFLIPFIQSKKIGFVDKKARVVIKPEYDVYSGEIKEKHDLIKVGVSWVEIRQYTPKGKVYNKIRYKWGVLDAKGLQVLDVIYDRVCISDTKELFSVRDLEFHWAVVDREKNTVIPFGVYERIDAFGYGYSRVKKSGKWGIVDQKGNLVLPTIYDEIWSFYNKTNLSSTTVIKDGVTQRFDFSTGRIVECKKLYKPKSCNEKYSYDDSINDALDGVPDAWSNLDFE